MPPQAAPPAPDVAPGIHPTLVDRNVVQATIIMGSGGVARSNPGLLPAAGDELHPGRRRLRLALDENRAQQGGLAYSIASGFDAGKFAGSFAINTQTKNKSTNEALQLISNNCATSRNIRSPTPSSTSAKKYLIGSFPLKLDRQSSIASFILQVQLYGLGLDYIDRYPKLIQAVTKDDILRVARKYLHPDALILVAVANQAQAAINVAKLKSVAEGGAPASAPTASAPAAATQAAQPAHGG